ncbi:hypothetical protein DFH94DRAFT_635049 [Russula ochroleuca]|uniref:Transposase n=1 Tax=Russula ochroleuca TaxID=152965 RepID=A0A9P5MRQ9_9AGAM|nr:hypothetical protein DFH94DRAFT_635049 [Russula ochroleuca]
MHLFGLNLSQLLVVLWRGSIEHAQDDNPTTWPFTVLHDNVVWQTHGASIAGAGLYLPVCLESRVPCNPAEKISSGYKAVEYLVYIFGLCPALLYGLLPQNFYYHFCKLVFATRVVHQHHKFKDNLLAAHQAFLEFVHEFEILYYECKLTCLHFVRPCIHALTHIVPEHFCLGSLTELSQWTMEQTIGNLGEEIQLHSDLYANLSQRAIEHARANALYAIAPDLFPVTRKQPSGACDAGDKYVLLGPCKRHEMSTSTSDTFKRFSDLHHWRMKNGDSLSVDRFARLLLPNGQIAQSWWQERKRPAEELALQGTSHFAEVLYFFLVIKDDLQYTLAAVKMFGAADPQMSEESYGTLHVCKYLGRNGVEVIDAKWIMGVVGMVPFKNVCGEANMLRVCSTLQLKK